MSKDYAPEIGEHWCKQKSGHHYAGTSRCEACGMARLENGMLVYTAEEPGTAGLRPKGYTPTDAKVVSTEPGGLKFDTEKVRMELLDPYAMEQLAAVLTFGAKKYAAHNWRLGIRNGRLLAALIRHVFAYLRGEDKDPETGLSHIAHAMCCCMFILGLEHRVDLDDRYKG